MIKALLIFCFIFSISNAFSKDIPVIVISPGKDLQSKSSVGSDVEVISNKTLKNSNRPMSVIVRVRKDQTSPYPCTIDIEWNQREKIHP